MANHYSEKFFTYFVFFHIHLLQVIQKLKLQAPESGRGSRTFQFSTQFGSNLKKGWFNFIFCICLSLHQVERKTVFKFVAYILKWQLQNGKYLSYC